MNIKKRPLLEEEAVFWGMILGVVAGLLWSLFNLPPQIQEARQQVLEQSKALREQISGDSVAESLEQGKSLARR